MSPKRKQIEVKSLRERFLLKDFINNYTNTYHIIYTPYNGIEKYDATWMSQSNNPNRSEPNKAIIEVKCRNWGMHNEGFMIQKDKYDWLMNQKDFNHIIYINFFHEEGILIWELNHASEPKWITTYDRANNYNEDMVEKVQGDLLKSQAIMILDKKIDLWSSLDKANTEWNKRNER